MEPWRVFLKQMARGGFGYYWIKEVDGQTRTIWWTTDNPPDLPADGNVYFGVNPSKTRKQSTERARNEDIAQVNAIYAEFDAKDFEGGKDAALAHVRQLSLRPSVLIDSGGGYHAYWMLAEPYQIHTVKDRNYIADIQGRWVLYVGGDKAVRDLARVLRVPGTYNYKYTPLREVIALEMDLDDPYFIEDLVQLLPKIQPPSAGGGNGQRSQVITQSRDITQSARHWLDKAMARGGDSQALNGIWLAAQLRDDGISHDVADDIVWDFVRQQPQLDPNDPWTYKDAQRLVRDAYRRPARPPAENRNRPANGNGHHATAQPAPVAELEPPEEPPVPEGSTLEPPEQPAGEELPDLEFLPYDVVLDALTLQEMGDADLLARLYKDQVVFDHSDKSWYQWAGNHWAVDSTRAVYRMVSRRVAPQYFFHAAKAEAMGQSDKAKKLAERAAGLRNKKRLDNVLFLAGGHEELALVGDEWDTNHMLLGCKNGVIDLRTGNFRPGQPRDYIRNISPVEWHGLDAPCPTWQRFVSEIFGEDPEMVSFLRRLMGYSITGLTIEQLFPILWGEGSNGKTTLLEIIGDVMGHDLATSSQADTLMEASRHNSGDSPKPFVFALRGKRLAWAMESNEGRRINEGLVKQLSGDDSITVRTLHSKPVTFKPTHKLFLVTNHKPHIAADGSAIWRRVLLVPFVQRFTDNPQGGERKKDQFLRVKLLEELPGILAWLVMGCLEWQEIGVKPPQAVMAATAEYREDEDTLALFISERAVLGDNKTIRSTELHKAYSTWCKEYGFDAMSLTAFSTRMKVRFRWKHTEKGNFLEGIGLSAEIPF